MTKLSSNFSGDTSLPQKAFAIFNDKLVQRTVLLLLLWSCLIGFLFLVRAVLLPFMLAGLLAFVLNPLITMACRFRIKKYLMPRYAAVCLVYLGLFACIYILGVFFAPQIYQEIARLAKEAGDNVHQLDDAHIQSIIAQVESFLQRLGLPVALGPAATADVNASLFSLDVQQVAKEMLAEFLELVRNQSTTIAVQIQHIVARVVTFVFEIFLVFMLTAFLLADTERIKNFMHSLVPVKNRPAFEGFLVKLDKGLSGVVRGQLLICLVNALLTLIGLLLIGVKFAFVLATIAGLFSLVPIFGSIISTVPIVLIGVTQSLTIGLLALAWIVGVHFLEANILNPKILGNSAKIHPVVIVLALVAGKHFYGLIGALLAVPITSILLTIFNSFLAKAIELDLASKKRSSRVN